MVEIINNINAGKINSEELGSLNLRRDIITTKNVEVALLQRELDSFLLILQNKYKLDTKKEYIIDKEGNIIESQKK